MSKVQAAVEASGLTAAELLQALTAEVDPREAAEQNAVTEDVTLAEMGFSLHQQLSRRDDDEQAEFFRGLTKQQQGALVGHLTNEGFAPSSIALSFGVPEVRVRELWEEFADKLGQRITGIRLQTLVGKMTASAEKLYEQAVKDRKLNLAWKIQTDTVKILQDLGVVDRAAYRTEVTHKLELSEDDEREMDELLELRRRRKEAIERVKRIDAEVSEGDELPELPGQYGRSSHDE